ncbi:MAG: stress-responsive transcription factor hsf1 [Piccolia ochrophora]|nr:MAG: stress-responsive transcription factor hsf1 [Piccolia ochrophora]
MPQQANPRKRPAPGASPSIQQHSQTPTQHSLQIPPSPSQYTNDQFLQWGGNPQGGGADGFPDTAADSGYRTSFDETNVGAPPAITATDGSPAHATSTQLTRRPAGQQLVARPPSYENHDGRQWSDGTDVLPAEAYGEYVQKNDDDLESLEQRALVAKRDALSKRKQIQPFVQKLSSFLDESRNTDLIRWSDSGDSFIVLDEDEFARTLIPEHFKHSNYASFVRQLNMYGFHKKVGLSDNSMRASERGNKSPSEYANPFFRRGHPNLLWLINKPKSTASGHKGRDGSAEAVGAEEAKTRQPTKEVAQSRMITSSGHGGDPNPGRSGKVLSSGQDMSEIQQQLQSIQQQQRIISSAIKGLQRDQNQIYEQAVAFQNLHDRHESSINAILTFLATVYNRSLDGRGGQNFSNSFANAIPHDAQGQRNVVDIGEAGSEGAPRRFKKQPLLLSAPTAATPDGPAGRASTMSPGSPSASPYPPQRPGTQGQSQPPSQAQTPGQAESVEELFSAANSPALTRDGDAPESTSDANPLPQQDIMSLINSANANNQNLQGASFDFPAALTHYQNANGNSPLTPTQRNNVLQMMAQNTNSAGANSNNALISPNPPQMPDLSQLESSQQQIDYLTKLQAEQDAKMQNLHNMMRPLSPTGSIPGLDSTYYNNGGAEVPSALDLDQIFNSGDYFANQDPDNLDFGQSNGVDDVGNFNFNDAMPSTNQGVEEGPEEDDSHVVGTVNGSSEETSPSNEDGVAADTYEGGRSPSKRRRVA